MGSTATLDVGAFQITWGKNEACQNHSDLFLRGDLRDAPYYYVADGDDADADVGDGDDDIEERVGDAIAIRKPAYVRPLGLVRRRLDLLGYSLGECRRLYENAHWSTWVDDDVPDFDSLAKVVSSFQIPNATCSRHGEDIDHLILTSLHAAGLAKQAPARDPFEQIDSVAHELDPYITLRLLAENPANHGVEVVWRFDDVVSGGWMDAATLYEPIAQRARWLVVTEGATDGRILRESLHAVVPDLQDFFDFVDMRENYPFTGTGNVLRFCQGLVRIHIMNQILVVLDNDTEGRNTHRAIANLNLPRNLRVTTLPDLDVCRSVRTIGPSGENREDINGRAVAIECFLDIWRDPADEPLVRWSNYVEPMDAYQGAIVDKDRYTRRFGDRARSAEPYDMRGLEALWSHLVAVCTA
jgi:hypothetical protein